MSRKVTRSGAKQPHSKRNVDPKHHDSYATKAKSPDSVVCDDCGLLLREGRWHRGAPPLGEVRGGRCPACERIHDRNPAGTINVPAELIRDRDELMNLIRGVEEVERAEHPLERIMEVGEGDSGMVITTTGMHLARRIASRLERTLHAKPTIHYGEESVVQIRWS